MPRDPAMLPRPSEFFQHWNLDPSVVYLNHGSFGGCPRGVMDAQHALRLRMERELVRFFIEDFCELMDEARKSLGEFLNCPWDCIAPVPNATVGVNTVLENQRFNPADEILTNGHEYPACQNALRRAASRSGAVVVHADIPFPCSGPDAVVNAVLSKVSARTRLALISHVTSPTGLVLPLERIVPALEGRGVRVLVDGAHAPGMVATLDLTKLNPSYYTANCHKWLCSPKGSAFLYVKRELQDGFRPLALSNNAEKPKQGRSQFLTEFEYVGTRDYTAVMTIPHAIRCMGSMVPGGWPEVMRRNHELVLRGRDIVCREMGMKPPAPDSMIGSICTMMLPSHPDEALRARLTARPTKYHDALQDNLIARHGIQVPVWGLAGKPERFIRISAQLYNSEAQYEYLAKALLEELQRERKS